VVNISKILNMHPNSQTFCGFGISLFLSFLYLFLEDITTGLYT
jgi:hypothetical protein